jgi:TRAP-type mannitol/chloroaromatic compound transport system permease small subunit
VAPNASRYDLPALWTAHIAAIAILLMLLLTVLVVVMRYGFATGSIALQEAITYCHAFAFLMGAAYTLQQDGHVRVDIFYRHFSPRQQAWVNALGVLLFLIPFALFLLACSWQMFLQSWQIREGSPDPGGLPFLYLLKGVVPLSMALLVFQGGILFFRAARTLVVRE